ncbi:class A beta-lactamase [Roseomonas haemaphysalidis]|uniref:Beta-lactamase n=1 Tax=Roseomonas haemaphysalidis TaxID=2768162 RepID=A0ABS3KPQ2_9PROT|nr:class A beta-lactamase [Roseomonas haemaphysalidis]MBO1078935.1 class A beta-lactamase [Roseomonas haemaphysalidis]
MINRRQWLGGALLALGAKRAWAQGGLAADFARIERQIGGRLGVAVLGTGGRVGHRVDERFPLGSTYKLLAAAGVLARVDAGQDRLDRRIRFSRADLVTYSPATEQHAGGPGMTLDAVCEAAMILSDNTAGNLLFDALGGPAGLTAWLRGLGDGMTRLDRIETALNEATPGDPRDTTSPAAMLGNLQKLLLGDALSAASRDRLAGWLRNNRTGDARLRARLPPGWQAGEKTGTSSHGTSNDVGLLWPPGGGKPVLVAAFITECPAPPARRDAALAEVGALVAAAA